MFMAQAPYASTYVGGYDRRGWTQVQIPAKGSVTIGGPIDKDICFHMGGTEYISNTTVKRLTVDTRYDTMAAVVSEGNWKTGGTAIIASGDNYPDALAASGLAGEPMLRSY